MHPLSAKPKRKTERVLGVQVNGTALRLVTVWQDQIDGWASLPYPNGERPTGPAWSAFLREGLAQARLPPWQQVWVLANPPSLQMRLLTFPKVRLPQLAKLVFWTFRKEIAFEEKTTAFNYEVEGEVPGDEAQHLLVTAHMVQRAETETLNRELAGGGLTPTGLVLSIHALRELLRKGWVAGSGLTDLVLHVSEGYAQLIIVQQGQVVQTRIFQTGVNASSTVHQTVWPQGEMDRLDPADRHALTLAVTRLAQQIERTIAAYLVGRNPEELGALLITGSLIDQPDLLAELGAQTGLKIKVMTLPPADRWASGVTPPPPGEAARLVPALAAALSHAGETPNLLVTHAEREHQRRVQRTSLYLALVCALLAVVLAAGSLWAYGEGLRAERTLRGLKREWMKFSPQPQRAQVDALAREAQDRWARMRQMVRAYEPVAVLAELGALTPPDIQLLLLNYVQPWPEKDPSQNATLLRVRGRVTGAPDRQAPTLAAYVLQVEESPLFEQVRLVNSESVREGADVVLLFEAEWTARASDPVSSRPSSGGGP